MSAKHIWVICAFMAIITISRSTKEEILTENETRVNMRDLKERWIVLEIAHLGVKYITDHYSKPHDLIRVFGAVKNSSTPTAYRLSMEIESNAEKRKICNVEALEKLNHKYKLVAIECTEKNVHGLVGGRKHIKITDVLVRDIVKSGFKELSKNFTGSPEQKLGVVYIESASVQVVAGLSYRVTIAVGLYENKKNGKLLDDNPNICTVNAWLKPWESNDPQITVECEDQNMFDKAKIPNESTIDKTNFPDENETKVSNENTNNKTKFPNEKTSEKPKVPK